MHAERARYAATAFITAKRSTWFIRPSRRKQFFIGWVAGAEAALARRFDSLERAHYKGADERAAKARPRAASRRARQAGVAGHGFCGHAWAAIAPPGPSVDVSERQMGLRRLGTESSPDSPLEGDGFELLVPRRESLGFPTYSG